MINVAIVGAGKLGFRVAEALLGGDYAITIIDKDEEVLSKLSQQLDVMTISADARDTGRAEEYRYSALQLPFSLHR